ncbi:hypothetical protein [Helicobacter sp. UBA3407]|uniref:hypothetical protein n=1 Tax=Helicobacter sp. UBA3407 TaxID=1946588 RepID=UPI0026376467|nr:hypothetical protein [Helicobacter sp. UBA3407]
MTQRDFAGRLGINVKTLRKWKKDRPKVCELLMIGLKAESMIDSLKENCCELEQLIQNKNAIKYSIYVYWEKKEIQAKGITRK